MTLQLLIFLDKEIGVGLDFTAGGGRVTLFFSTPVEYGGFDALSVYLYLRYAVANR